MTEVMNSPRLLICSKICSRYSFKGCVVAEHNLTYWNKDGLGYNLFCTRGDYYYAELRCFKGTRAGRFSSRFLASEGHQCWINMHVYKRFINMKHNIFYEFNYEPVFVIYIVWKQDIIIPTMSLCSFVLTGVTRLLESIGANYVPQGFV